MQLPVLIETHLLGRIKDELGNLPFSFPVTFSLLIRLLKRGAAALHPGPVFEYGNKEINLPPCQ